MKKIITLLVCIAVCCSVAVNAQVANRGEIQGSSGSSFEKVGGAGAQFLRIGVGARANGMAGAFTGVANDVSALFYNSAGIVDIKGYAADVSYTSWFGGFTHNFIGGVIPAGDKYRVGIGITSLSSGDIPLTTVEQGNSLGTSYTINDFALGATFAGMLTDQFSFGVTMKYVQNTFFSVAASGVALDVGTMYRFDGIRLGFSVSNLGPQMAYTGNGLTTRLQTNNSLPGNPTDLTLSANNFNMPLSFKAGLACDLMSELLGEYQSAPDLGISQEREYRWLLSADFETLSDVREQYGIGTEFTWKDIVSFRGGYRAGMDSFGVMAGVGIRYVGGGFDGSLDYAMQPSSTIGMVNRISVSLRLN
jgi:hypothetical protein